MFYKTHIPGCAMKQNVVQISMLAQKRNPSASATSLKYDNIFFIQENMFAVKQKNICKYPPPSPHQ